jgi:hypothetical protein
VARVPVMHARRCLLCAACIAVCVAGVRGEDGSASSPSPPPPSPGTSYSEGPILRTVVSVGIIAFALMALYGCWMRHRDDSVEMDRRRAERERHLDSALGEHLHLGQRESRRLARTELEKQERAERAEKEKQAAAASADVGGLRHGGALSVEMSEMSERGISPVQVRVVDMPSEDERSPRGEEIDAMGLEREDDRAPLFGFSSRARQKSM